MQFLSDNAAAVHPTVWEALKAADSPDSPYDGDALSAALDERFAQVFGKPCTVLWAATGTAANCLALATMVQPHGAVVCHEEAHIEVDEGGAPGFFLHGAKLILCEGAGAKLSLGRSAMRSIRSATMCIKSSPMPFRSPRRASTVAATGRQKWRRLLR